MSQASCTAYRPDVIDALPLSSVDEFESVFSKFARRIAIGWTRRKNVRTLSKLDADRLRDIGIRPWQVGEVSRKAAEAQLTEPRYFGP